MSWCGLCQSHGCTCNQPSAPAWSPDYKGSLEPPPIRPLTYYQEGRADERAAIIADLRREELCKPKKVEERKLLCRLIVRYEQGEHEEK